MNQTVHNQADVARFGAWVFFATSTKLPSLSVRSDATATPNRNILLATGHLSSEPPNHIPRTSTNSVETCLTGFRAPLLSKAKIAMVSPREYRRVPTLWFEA